MYWQLFALDPAKLSPRERMIARLAFVLAILALCWTLRDLRNLAGIDLRNRVVGARVMLAGHDPYAFVWQEGMPEEWLDPVHDPQAHRLTISPPTLLLYATIAPLPYKAQRVVSFLAEWSAMLASLALLSRSLPTDRLRLVFLASAVVFFLASDIWRSHLERGQIYVFLLFGLSVAIWRSRGGRDDTFTAGFALGVLALMRPNFGLVLAALLWRRQWRSGGAMLGTIIVGLAATWLVVPPTTFASYRDVGEQYYRALDDPNGVPVRPRPTLEMVAEGVDFNRSLNSAESSSFAMLCYWLRPHVDILAFDLGKASKAFLAVLAFGLLGLLTARPRADSASAFTLAILFALDTDVFLPHRWLYVDVVLLAPLALLLPRLAESDDQAIAVGGIVTLGLFLGLLGAALDLIYLATIMRAWLVLGGLTVLSVRAFWASGTA